MENKELFYKFVEYLKQSLKEKYPVWDKSRIKATKDHVNKRKLILHELSYFDYNDPLDSIDKNYLLEKYNPNLLLVELQDINIMVEEDNNSLIFEKVEKIERIQKILDYYLTFVIEKNFDYLSKFFL